MSRRRLLIGAGLGGVAVAGGAAGWVLSSRSAPASPSAPVTLPAGTAPSLSQQLRLYYGDGARRAAVWKFATGNAIQANPGVGSGLVFVGSTDNSLYAVTVADGRRAWAYQSGAVTAAPQVVGGIVCVATSEGQFHALRVADGTRVWGADTGVAAMYKPNWAVDGGSVILAVAGAPARAYDVATGAKGMRFSTQEPYLMALSAANGILYALDASGILYAFRTATGAELWRRTLLSADDASGTGLAVGGGGIYLGTASGTLYAISAATGHGRWTYHPGSRISATPAVAGGLVYLQDGNGTVHAVDTATGRKAWSRASVQAGLWGVTAAGGLVYYSTDLAVQSLDAKTGAPVSAFTPSGTAPSTVAFLSTPAVAGGMVFVGASDDGLYAFRA